MGLDVNLLNMFQSLDYVLNPCFQVPQKFDFVASDDCNASNFSTWHSILRVQDAGFTFSGQAKAWEIPQQKRATFLCFGFRIYSNFRDSPPACFHDARMWEERH